MASDSSAVSHNLNGFKHRDNPSMAARPLARQAILRLFHLRRICGQLCLPDFLSRPLQSVSPAPAAALAYMSRVVLCSTGTVTARVTVERLCHTGETLHCELALWGWQRQTPSARLWRAGHVCAHRTPLAHLYISHHGMPLTTLPASSSTMRRGRQRLLLYHLLRVSRWRVVR